MPYKLSKYPNYKPSGLDWLGDIPDGWEVNRIKEIFNYFGSGSTPQTSNTDFYQDGTVNWLNTTDLDNNYIYYTKEKITFKALKESNLKVFPINSLVIAMYGQGKTRGTVGLLKIKTCTNQACCVMYGTADSDEKYILWWFITKYDDIRSINIGATQPNMNKDFVKFLYISKPPLQTQIKIAKYLDQQTANIDKEIDLLTQKAEKYKQLKQTLISETVTKGLDKTTKLKPSGIEWIGDIPQGWEVKRLKDIYKMSMGNTILKDDLIDNGIIPVYSATAEDKFFGHVNSANIILKPFDLVICARGSIGHVKIVKEICTSTQTTIACKKLTMKISAKFVYYFLSGFNDTIFKFDKTAIPQFTVEDANYIHLPFPPLQTQKLIADYLDQQTGKIDQIISTINQKIDKLKQYRKVLINDVVVGKVRVEE